MMVQKVGVKMNIYIVRHGKTQFNNEERMQGFADSPLLPESLELAIETGKGFKADNIHFDKVYASDLLRAVRTSEHIVIGMESNQEVIIEPLVKEMNFGAAEGQKVVDVWDQIAQSMDYADMAALFAVEHPHSIFDFVHQYEPFSEAESIDQFYTRIKAGLDKIVEENYGKGVKNILITAHGLVILGLLNVLGYDTGNSRSFSNLSINHIRYDGEYTVVDVNKSYIE